jgi:hypothetical protein
MTDFSKNIKRPITLSRLFVNSVENKLVPAEPFRVYKDEPEMKKGNQINIVAPDNLIVE